MAAVDATGLETRHVREHFGKRRGDGKRSGHRQRAWPKLTAVLHTHSHLIIGVMTGIGPSQDSPDFTLVMCQATSTMAFDTVLADAGYDAEHNHRLCCEDLGIARIVNALNRHNTGWRWPKTPYRRVLRQCSPQGLYHQRWHIERRLQSAQAPPRFSADRTRTSGPAPRTHPACPHSQPHAPRRNRMSFSTEHPQF